MRAEKYCAMSSLAREDLMDALNRYPEAIEHMKELAVERAIDLKPKVQRAKTKMKVVMKMSAMSIMKTKNKDSSQSSLSPKPSISNILNGPEVALSRTSETTYGAGVANFLPPSFDHHAGNFPFSHEIRKENEVESKLVPGRE